MFAENHKVLQEIIVELTKSYNGRTNGRKVVPIYPPTPLLNGEA